jgi:hypothetical protein
MENRFATMTRTEPSVLSTNKVIRNTYMLLSLTLAFSALTAACRWRWARRAWAS